MKRRRTAILLITGIGVAAIEASGCRRTVTPVAPPPPTTRVAVATRPAPAAVEPLPSSFTISGQSFTFPAARIVSLAKDGGVRVTLFSDDPPEAVRDNYTGNSFYFRLTLDADAADDLAGQQFVFHNSVSEQDDTTSGLFVAGGRQTLRPVDASVSFDRIDRQLVVRIAGSFKLYDEQTAGETPPIVRVDAMLDPTAVAEKK